MEVHAQYLKAIQSIAGSTPGEKYRTINSVVKKMASDSKGDRVIPEDIPEVLMPLVRVEMAKLLRQYEGIIEALKSEDLAVVRRALKATWFFEYLNEKETETSCRYFLKNLTAEMSLFARSRVIKKFAIHMRDVRIGAEFFNEIYETYGANQAVPMLLACDEDFTFETINEKNIVLPTWVVRKIYRKYPSLVIEYLKLGEPRDEENVRNIRGIDINNYKEFLPTLAKDRFDDFMAVYDSHGGMDLKLDEKTSNKFVETRLNLIAANPAKYLNLAPLKIVTEKLSDEDFKGMFKKLFPPHRDDFAYDYLYGTLKYYKSEENGAPLILDIFRELYGEDLLSGKFLTSPNFVRTLPASARVRYARSMLKRDKFWYYWDRHYSWRCYLPTSESVPLIIGEIARTPNRSKRIGLEEQLFFTCEVNGDEKALLRVLNYLYDNHRDDDYTLKIVCSSCDATKLGPAHWKVFEKSFELLKNRGDCERVEITKALETAFHYCSSNDLPYDEYVEIFVNLRIERGWEGWNVLKKFMNLEKKFLELFVKFISTRRPFAEKKSREREFDVVRGLATSLWDFNERHKSSLSKKLSVEEYPWLMKNMENFFIVDDNEAYRESERLFFVRCRRQEPGLYDYWIRKHENFWLLGAQVILDVLYKEPKRVSKNWRECLKEVRDTKRQKHVVEIFLRRSKWHENLPINFFNELIAAHLFPETRLSSLKMLALLTDGVTYGKIIEAFIYRGNKNDTIDAASNLAKVNPPVGFEIISKIFDADYFGTTLRFSESVCRGLRVAKVASLAKILTTRSEKVSKKHGIRLGGSVAPLEVQYESLASMCKIETDVSIRRILFYTIRDLFRAQPDPRSWKLFENCIEKLGAADDVEIFKNFDTLSWVPNDYVFPYVRTVLNAVESGRARSEDPKFFGEIICGFVKSIDDKIAELLPEEYLGDLIRRYLFVFEYDSRIAEAATELTVSRYILTSIKNDRLTTRLKFFGDHLRRSVKKYWDTPGPSNRQFYPMNFMVNRFFQTICGGVTERTDVRIYEELLKNFLSVLEPHQDASSYLQLVFSVGFHGSETSTDFGRKISGKIREAMDIFSPEYAVVVAAKFADFMKTRAFSDPETGDETIFTIAENFLAEGSVPCAMIAANMLFATKSKKLHRRHVDLIHSLKAIRNSGVSSVVNANLSAFKYPDPEYEDDLSSS
ncbi:uncharacterized protein LOC110117222 [Athalia rosae]|uniref:uncharacterized protein LOC110117222 n=1 Tax=Athalia rosae TaxID=37344 RepID=UPI0020349CA5|nr:uncharacterized protein LOC110117222 [Athalia rosae]